MVPLGTPAPAFSLPNVVDGRTVSLAGFAGEPLLVMFLCNHCPFVKHVRTGLASFAYEYSRKGLSIVAINSNDVQSHPDDSPEKMKTEAAEAGYVFPYLFDESQDVARAFQAACTPDFFLFDQERKLVYRGQLDDARPENGKPIDGRDLRAAIEAVLAGEAVNPDQKPSVGCNIKWKPGNAPGYIAS